MHWGVGRECPERVFSSRVGLRRTRYFRMVVVGGGGGNSTQNILLQSQSGERLGCAPWC